MQTKITVLLCLLTATLWGQNTFKVVGTASIFSDMARNIAGDAPMEITSIVPIGGDPHIYEPTPKDAKLAAEADLILMNGLTFEGWLKELIDNSGTKAAIKLITTGVTPIESDRYQNATDPHAWMDPVFGLIYIKNIRDALVELDPANAEMFEFNYQVYKKQLEDLHTSIQEQINTIPEKQRVLITSHDAFRYYGNRYGLHLESVLGVSTDAEVQTSDIIRLNKIIQENNVPAVFIETTVNPKLLKQLAEDNGVSVGGSLFSDSIGDANSDAPTYLDMLIYNTRTIVHALGKQKQENQEESKAEGKVPVWWWVLGGILLLILPVFLFGRRKS
ncbi:MAG: zinc ABC transporter substrate-binding protein [Saprospiraceae bacterium]|nr:zinc ABC transporter substrate-binding protein [Saprospiraceae bacterium]